MAARTLPGIALTGGYDLDETGWHTTMNANLLKLSALVQITVLSKDTALPGSPTNGDIYVVPSGGDANKIAVRDNGAWVYYIPAEGWHVWVNDLNLPYWFNGTSWVPLATAGGVPPNARTVSGGGLATGGGDLSANRTITVPAAAASDLRTGTDTTKALTSANALDAAAWVGLTDAATIVVDHGAGVNRNVTLGGNRAFGAPSNAKPGWALVIRVKQDGTGTRVPTWASDYDFGDAGTPVLSTGANAEDILSFMCIASGKFAYFGMRKGIE